MSLRTSIVDHRLNGRKIRFLCRMKKRNDYGSCFKVMKENRPPPGSYDVSGNVRLS